MNIEDFVLYSDDHFEFHPLGNELYCKRDLDAANLRPALEQGCGRQPPSASILFFHTNVVCVLRFKM